VTEVVLSAEDVRRFREEGFVSPLRVMEEAEAADLLAVIERHEAHEGKPLDGATRHKTHLLFRRLGELVVDRRVVEPIIDLYGQNLLCWSTSFFIKEPRDPAFVSWHQDATYWGLSRPDVVTAWVALSPSTRANGALEVIPGTHLEDQLPHRDTFDPANLLSRGQEVAVDVDEARAVTLELQPGEMSLHDVRLVHGSAPNRSDERRVGFAIRYLPTSVAPVGRVDSATLVSGVDQFLHFEHEPLPSQDFAPAFVDLHRRLTDQQAAALFAGTDRDRYE
jgi:non-heme Fe2+,alpha-ketoglutarate-dependent halogenase